MTHHPSAASLRLHGARLLFPPAATLLFLLLTEYIARGTLSGLDYASGFSAERDRKSVV